MAAGLASSAVSASGLTDAPIVGDAIQYLSGEGWVADNGAGLTIGGRVPGDLITDLEAAGVIADPWYEMNWVPMGSTSTPPVWDATNWTYSLEFDAATNVLSGAEVLLVLDGVKMAADVTINGNYLGYVNDQFLRYTWPVTGALKATGNTLTVTFTTSSDPRNDQARFMGCTGGW